MTESQSVFRTALSWILYHLGDWVSLIVYHWDVHFLHVTYNRLMGWSVNLDKAGKIWKHVEEE